MEMCVSSGEYSIKCTKSKLIKESEISQSSPTLCDPMDFSLPGSSVHGIFQARILEWVAISFSRGYFQFRCLFKFRIFQSYLKNWNHYIHYYLNQYY